MRFNLSQALRKPQKALIALAADEIVMDPNAVLGPVDPQLGDMPAASILRAVNTKTPEKVEDQTLILADMDGKAVTQVAAKVAALLEKRMPKDKAIHYSRFAPVDGCPILIFFQHRDTVP